jgi:protoporphyrinogen oxidase
VIDDIVILGGGPSGLAAAFEAVFRGARSTVIERLDRVGGLARTLEFAGARFDIGPHRFFTKNREVQSLFTGIVAEDLVTVPRLTRIFCADSFFNYPLTPVNALLGVGVAQSARVLASYALARGKRLFDSRPAESFEDWVVDKFGRRLHEIFFKTYTEKVWGIPCTDIGADWAGQRIKGLSLAAAVTQALFKARAPAAKSLVNEFLYPRLGAGQLYEKLATRIERHGSRVLRGAEVRRIRRDGFRVRAVEALDGAGASHAIEGKSFLASVPLTEMLEMMDPAPPAEILAAARSLRYRNHVGVNLLVEGRPFPDNWIYVHAKEVGMARIANYANFSPEMKSPEGLNPLTIEYFCFPGDGVWDAADAALIARATCELDQMKLVPRERVRSGFVVRSDKAYPVIEIGYERRLALIKGWLDRFENLLPIGRSGMFKYNNQDHAMATGMLAARTALGLGRFDPWLVNIDAEYHEAGPAAAAAPEPSRRTKAA